MNVNLTDKIQNYEVKIPVFLVECLFERREELAEQGVKLPAAGESCFNARSHGWHLWGQSHEREVLEQYGDLIDGIITPAYTLAILRGKSRIRLHRIFSKLYPASAGDYATGPPPSAKNKSRSKGKGKAKNTIRDDDEKSGVGGYCSSGSA
jgi:hypothetical protein